MSDIEERIDSASGNDISDVGRSKCRFKPPCTFWLSLARSPVLYDCGRLGCGIGIGDVNDLTSCSRTRSDIFLLFDFLRGESVSFALLLGVNVGIVEEWVTAVKFSGRRLVWEAVVAA